MDIYDRKNKVRREIYNEMLKNGQQKQSTRLCDRVIMRERVEKKCHDHIQKPKAFCKAQTISELILTLIRRALTESKQKREGRKRHSEKLQNSSNITRIYEKEYECMGNA